MVQPTKLTGILLPRAGMPSEGVNVSRLTLESRSVLGADLYVPDDDVDTIATLETPDKQRRYFKVKGFVLEEM